ncbi:MAG: Omp28-related outer membrane protein [Flavobacteriales bacterium]|nr:Omp28-related outer membrane protein [Flavobacteriales bacterium]
MKKLFLFATAASLFLFSCKDDSADPNGGGTGNTTTAPKSYTQNSVIEYFSGAWCGYCPDGWLRAESIMEANPGRVEAVVIHRGDGMENPNGVTIDGQYNKAGYPTGMVNRIGGTTESRTGWNAKVSQVLSNAGKCGLAISTTKESGTNYKVKIKLGIGDKDLPDGSYKLVVYGVNKVVTGTGSAFDQVNYYYNAAQFPGHPYNNVGRKVTQSNGAIIGIIEGYEHKHVVSYVLSNALGDPVDSDKVKAGSLSEYEYSINTLGDDVFIMAMLYENTLATGTSFVHNASWVDVGSSVDFK